MAISRNAIVIAVGFTPLLLAPLVPYITVGIFLASIMAVSAIVTLVLLPPAMQPSIEHSAEDYVRGDSQGFVLANPSRDFVIQGLAVALLTSGKPVLSLHMIRLVQLIVEINRAFPRVATLRS